MLWSRHLKIKLLLFMAFLAVSSSFNSNARALGVGNACPSVKAQSPSSFFLSSISDPRLQTILIETNPPSCGTDAILRQPEVQSGIAANERLLLKAMQRRMLMASVIGGEPLYTIPLVFHVIHLGEAVGIGSNISDAQIQSAVTALNHQFRKVTGSTGDGAGVDTNMQFVLAKRDPSGQPHSGIIRVNGSTVANYATQGIRSSGSTPGALASAIKALSVWPRDQYINIWVVTEIDDNSGGSGVQGYASFPYNSYEDGIVILGSAVGTLGTAKSYTNQGKVLTHEMGHIFSLYHTFHQTLACGAETDCASQGDAVCDTPSTIQSSSCTSPACSGTQQVQNYLDYTPQTCQNLFTQGQKDRMRATLESARMGLITSPGGTPVYPLDLSITPSETPPYLCQVGYQPKANLLNLGSSTITFATVRYRINGGAWESTSYSGSLASGASTVVTLPPMPTLPSGSHTLEMNVTSPNNGTDGNPGNDSASFSFSISTSSETVRVSFTLDFYGAENGYTIMSGTNTLYSGGPFANGVQGTIVNNDHCLIPGCYSVKLFDQHGDGQSFSSGSYRILNGAGTQLASGSGNWGASQTHTICLGGAGGGTGGGTLDTTPPSVSITSPSTATQLNRASSSLLSITANASDNIGISKVEFYSGSTLIGTKTTSPYTLSWNTSGVADGTFSLTAKAYDLVLNSTTSAAVSVTIDRTLPTGSLTSPTHVSILSGTSVTLSTNATDTVGLARVEYYNNGVLLSSVSTPPYSYTWDPSALSPGSYTISTKVFDNAGNVFTPSSVNVIQPGAVSFSNSAVLGSFLGVSPGCYTRAQSETFLNSFGCGSGCGTTYDVNGDGVLNTLDLIAVMGNICHE